MSDAPTRILSGTLLLIYLVFILSGGICVVFSLIIYLYWTAASFWSGVLGNVGCSILASAFTLYLIQRFTDKINLEIQRGNWVEMEAIVARAIRSLDSKISNLESYTHRDALRLEGLSDHLLDDGFRKMSIRSGIERAFSAVGGEVDDEFIRGGRNLVVKLKDGKSFFPKRIGTLESRVRNKLQTTVLIFHPESEHLSAVADMDNNKRGRPYIQKQDSEAAIRQMHAMRDRLSADGVRTEEFVEFIGYRFVPTWVGFLGPEIAYIHLYFSHPYRGPLNTLGIVKGYDDSTTNWYASYDRDIEETVRQAKEELGWNLWEHRIDEVAGSRRGRGPRS
ncbi:hypothetical protein IC762_02190 [Bradyrhizobium genosp. L]|uniref:hypothetical protein n=1 Tax=Bradyrhizobium genosp. L TaxID=83637 RepID=UPI0018A2FC65|nr:hypothetical protein [Bradyrhizobium genosp. L]QPF85167.1 hypothetical protein IC762_02190 [Bradyrhizobium genosp. L]